jgi:rhodanese-related sulfurtransferase
MAGRGTPKTVDELPAQARAVLRRPTPADALHAQASGALLVDIRGDDQRRDGLIPGAIVIPRNCLEWRCEPPSPWRHPAITGRDLHIILICQQGYQSSLATATLQQLSLTHATDLNGGFTAWATAGLPMIAPPQPAKTHPVTNDPRGPAAWPTWFMPARHAKRPRRALSLRRPRSTKRSMSKHRM